METEEDGGELAEVLGVMEIEELIRLRHRLRKKGRDRMVAVLDLEIGKREGKE